MTIHLAAANPLTWLLFFGPAALMSFADSVISALFSRYTVLRTCAGVRFRVFVRWYAPGCHVVLKGTPYTWTVLEWENENGPLWVKLGDPDGDPDGTWWAALDYLEPGTVRVFRPRISRSGISVFTRRPSDLTARRWVALCPHLRLNLPPPGFPGNHLELAPQRLVPLTGLQPVPEHRLKVGHVLRVAVSLELVLRAPLAEHF